MASASRVNSGGNSAPCSAGRAASMIASRGLVPGSCAPSGAELDQQCRRGERQVLPPVGVPGKAWLATMRDAATISSTAVAPAATRSGTTAQASSMLRKCSQTALRCCGSGTVSKTTSLTKARVPSEPISRRQRSPAGSRRRAGHQPVARRVLDLELAPHPLRQVGVGEQLGAAAAAGLRQATGSAAANASSAPGAAVSITVPEGRTNVSERPLVAVVAHPAPHAAGAVGETPPMVATSLLAGSGPACGRGRPAPG